MENQQSSQPLLPVQLFDPDADVSIVERNLPHWSQAGAVAFITWRTQDSMPIQVLHRWNDDRRHWLRAHGIDPDDPSWRRRLQQIDRCVARAFLEAFWNRWHDALDAGHGACVLRQPELSEIV